MLTSNELIFYDEKDENGNSVIMSGGYKVNSILLQKKIPLMVGGSKKEKDKVREEETNNVSDLFKNLGVPAGLCYIQNKNANFKMPLFSTNEDDDKHSESSESSESSEDSKNSKNIKSNKHKNDNIIPISVYDELLNIVNVNNLNKTKKNKERFSKNKNKNKNKRTKKIKNKK